MKKLDDYLEEAIANIRDDRGITKDLLDDVIRLIGKDEEHHKLRHECFWKTHHRRYGRENRILQDSFEWIEIFLG